jgi:hypothetical protein
VPCNASSMYSCKRPNDIDSLLVMRCIVTPLRKPLETTTGLQIFTRTHRTFHGLCTKRPSEFVLALLARLSDTVRLIIRQFYHNLVSRFRRVSVLSKSIIATWTEEQMTSFLKKKIKERHVYFQKKKTIITNIFTKIVWGYSRKPAHRNHLYTQPQNVLV